MFSLFHCLHCPLSFSHFHVVYNITIFYWDPVANEAAAFFGIFGYEDGLERYTEIFGVPSDFAPGIFGWIFQFTKIQHLIDFLETYTEHFHILLCLCFEIFGSFDRREFAQCTIDLLMFGGGFARHFLKLYTTTTAWSTHDLWITVLY